MGDVIGDPEQPGVARSRGHGQSGATQARGQGVSFRWRTCSAPPPPYVNTLRSMSQGRAQYTMFFDHYEEVPQAIADEVKAKLA